MSYCRFSSDNWMCDVYVYEDVSGGWTTHVAGRRSVIPPIPDLPIMWGVGLAGQWDKEARRFVYASRWQALQARLIFGFKAFWSHHLHMRSRELIPLRPIGGKHDGETFNSADPFECAELLVYLRHHGYKVPQYAIDALREEELQPEPTA
ncbi:MAG: hypothetical protein V4757_06990 [Pseudomonadota bacterium]